MSNNKEIIGDDYPTYEDSVNATLNEAFEDAVNRENEYVNLQKENRELKHRLSMIKQDIKLVVRHIENNCDEIFKQSSLEEDGEVYADEAWHNVSNIEIACDLECEDVFEWRVVQRM
tara:strand:- start:12 stop:362 length:351 start_codon:yes stop_codon:yes gene_type:complete